MPRSPVIPTFNFLFYCKVCDVDNVSPLRGPSPNPVPTLSVSLSLSQGGRPVEYWEGGGGGALKRDAKYFTKKDGPSLYTPAIHR